MFFKWQVKTTDVGYCRYGNSSVTHNNFSAFLWEKKTKKRQQTRVHYTIHGIVYFCFFLLIVHLLQAKVSLLGSVVVALNLPKVQMFNVWTKLLAHPCPTHLNCHIQNIHCLWVGVWVDEWINEWVVVKPFFGLLTAIKKSNIL